MGGESRLQTQEELRPALALLAVRPGIYPFLFLCLSYRSLINGATRLISVDVV